MWHRHSCLCWSSRDLRSEALPARRLWPEHRQECLCHIGPLLRRQARRLDQIVRNAGQSDMSDEVGRFQERVRLAPDLSGWRVRPTSGMSDTPLIDYAIAPGGLV